MTRSSMLEVLLTAYVRTGRAKGLLERGVVLRHALPNALVPVLTVTGLEFGFILGGAILVETVFSYPGVGWMMVEAIGTRDFPIVQGGVLLVAFSFVLINFVVDLLYAVLDPRIRY
jgi:peptide/nickel transport system permease protein